MVSNKGLLSCCLIGVDSKFDHWDNDASLLRIIDTSITYATSIEVGFKLGYNWTHLKWPLWIIYFVNSSRTLLLLGNVVSIGTQFKGTN